MSTFVKSFREVLPSMADTAQNGRLKRTADGFPTAPMKSSREPLRKAVATPTPEASEAEERLTKLNLVELILNLEAFPLRDRGFLEHAINQSRVGVAQSVEVEIDVRILHRIGRLGWSVVPGLRFLVLISRPGQPSLRGQRIGASIVWEGQGTDLFIGWPS